LPAAITSTTAARCIASRVSLSSSVRRTSNPALTASIAERRTVTRSCRRCEAEEVSALAGDRPTPRVP
jgi:hypothetical protein